MKLLYTGAKSFEAEQRLPEQSLGNYISSTEVPNMTLNALFDTISQYTIKLNKSEMRVLSLFSDEVAPATSVKMWIDYPNSADSSPGDSNIAFFKLGFAVALSDSCGDLYVSSIQSPYGAPYGVTLAEADGEDNAISLPDIPVGGYLIIYIQRILDPIVQIAPTSEELLDILNEVTVLDKQEEAELKFTWLP